MSSYPCGASGSSPQQLGLMKLDTCVIIELKTAITMVIRFILVGKPTIGLAAYQSKADFLLTN